MKILITCLGVLCVATIHCSARLVTLVVKGDQSQKVLVLQTNESLKVVSARDFSGPNMSLRIEREGAILHLAHNHLVGWHPVNEQNFPMNPVQLTGPALVVFRSNLADRPLNEPAYVTLEITPEPYPAEKAIVVSQGTGATISVESSTNLTDWTVEWVQVQTSTNVNRFYRIKLDQLP